MALREKGVSTSGEGVGHGVGEDGSNFLDGVAGRFVGRRRTGDVLIFADQARDAVSISMIFAGFVLDLEVVLLQRRVQRVSRLESPPATVSFIVCSHFNAMWSVTSLKRRPHK